MVDSTVDGEVTVTLGKSEWMRLNDLVIALERIAVAQLRIAAAQDALAVIAYLNSPTAQGHVQIARGLRSKKEGVEHARAIHEGVEHVLTSFLRDLSYQAAAAAAAAKKGDGT